MRPAPVKDLAASSFSIDPEQQKIPSGKIISELCRGTGRREDSLWLSCPQRRAGACGRRISRMRYSLCIFIGKWQLSWTDRLIYRGAFAIVSEPAQTLVPGDVPRVASINKWRAPRVNDDTLSARHCITECIYSICPGTKVWGPGTWLRSLQRPASC